MVHENVKNSAKKAAANKWFRINTSLYYFKKSQTGFHYLLDKNKKTFTKIRPIFVKQKIEIKPFFVLTNSWLGGWAGLVVVVFLRLEPAIHRLVSAAAAIYHASSRLVVPVHFGPLPPTVPLWIGSRGTSEISWKDISQNDWCKFLFWIRDFRASNSNLKNFAAVKNNLLIFPIVKYINVKWDNQYLKFAFISYFAKPTIPKIFKIGQHFWKHIANLSFWQNPINMYRTYLKFAKITSLLIVLLQKIS